MGWRELRVVVPRAATVRVTDELFTLGASGLQEDWLPGEAPPPRQPWDTGPPPALPERQVIVAWFEDPDETAVVAGLPDEATAPTWSDVPDTDWETSWREGFAPIVVHDDLVIAPPWDAPAGALIIEPGQGFGTGEHPSTRQALLLLDEVVQGDHDVLDVGCGSGILALAAARRGAFARGIDVEAAAIVAAEDNATRNGLRAVFDTTPIDRIERPYPLVAANLHAELLVALADDLVRLTGAWLICAGILAEREGKVRAALDPHFHLDARLDDGSWIGLRYRVRR